MIFLEDNKELTRFMNFHDFKSATTKSIEPAIHVGERLIKIANALGLSVIFVDKFMHDDLVNYVAKDKTIYLCKRENQKENNSNLAHELGHFLAANAAEQKLDNYGLNASPDDVGSKYWKRNSVKKTARKKVDKIEQAASFSGMLLEWLVGSDVCWTYMYHGWNEIVELKSEMKYFSKYLPVVTELVEKTGCRA